MTPRGNRHRDTRKRKASLLGAGLLLCGSALAAGPLGQLAMDQVSWSYTGDRFACKLELGLPGTGHLTFTQSAGTPLHLGFHASQADLRRVAVASVTAPWQVQRRSSPSHLIRHKKIFRLDADNSAALLQSLDEGFWTILILDSREWRIPTIGWAPVAEEFRQCRQRLSPLSVLQARDQVMYYRPGQRSLDEQQLDRLSELARYIQLDPKVQRLLVDSYTDNTGSRLGNLQISRERAADVAAALRSAGVNGDLIEQRAHGDRYPSASNGTAEGRGFNRKVTIRVVRQDTEERP